ncbi:MAG: DEAD/DEAH box helicase family protein [Opitutales bacterium]|nr:DEAD/DEAH box helicase family protein [Opitutales bacterium]
MPNEPNLPFPPDTWLIDRNNPAQRGQFTGRTSRVGRLTMVELRYPTGERVMRPLHVLEEVPDTEETSIEGRIRSGRLGKRADLRRLITFEKLRGKLHEVIYSMEAAQIDFLPYQFKPVIKFINSPTERMIIADEVGLGKTIEAMLIWLEMQARRNARRLLVVCPKTLAPKWRDELRTKFTVDARIVDFRLLQEEIDELARTGETHEFVTIATYTGLRPPKKEIRLLESALEPEDEDAATGRTALLRRLRHWGETWEPFDLVIFDEAHYLRNPQTTTFHLGKSLALSAASVLCVSATPVNNKNVDLHSLLRLVDDEFFETQGSFEQLLESNRPAVNLANALARIPLDTDLLQRAVSEMSRNRALRDTRLFARLLEQLELLESNRGGPALIAECQMIAERLNFFGNYINRTRRVQIKERRPIRVPLTYAVTYTPEERRLYEAILSLVRRRCARDRRPFHVFQVLGLQLRAASCLPVLAGEIRDGRFGDADELLAEAFGEETVEAFEEEPADGPRDGDEPPTTSSYDFEANDTKFKELLKVLVDGFREEPKVIIFAYYRPTLRYLERRLTAEGISVTRIDGTVVDDERWRQLDRFKDPHGPRILLSSEVGSEGIDLQFCRVLINYDLPWNPMRVEQRIGRIDRVGQRAERLSIINFKVRNTVEERLYNRLHAKLFLVETSLGDMEAIVGEEVQSLTVDLLSKELTPEEEEIRIEQTERVLHNRSATLRQLEESGDALIGLSDYVQDKIEEDRERGRYITADELEDYLADFFQREFRGCEILSNTPERGCIFLRLTPEAQESLSEVLADNRTLAARFLRQREFAITFRREVRERLSAAQARKVHFVNHLSPLVKWMTKVNQASAQSFYNTSALIVSTNNLPPGVYAYKVERWKMAGLGNRENMAYAVMGLADGEPVAPDVAEQTVQTLLRDGRDWDYPEFDPERVLETLEAMEEQLLARFGKAFSDFEDENEAALNMRVQRTESHFNRRIDQDRRQLQTLRERERSERVIQMTENRLQRNLRLKEEKLRKLRQRGETDLSQQTVGAGVFLVS